MIRDYNETEDRFSGMPFSFMFCGPLRLRPRLRAIRFGWKVFTMAIRGWSLQVQIERTKALSGNGIVYKK